MLTAQIENDTATQNWSMKMITDYRNYKNNFDFKMNAVIYLITSIKYCRHLLKHDIIEKQPNSTCKLQYLKVKIKQPINIKLKVTQSKSLF